jgi:pectate disaccharide-lyase
VVIGNDKPVKAGEMFTQPATLGEKNDFRLTFTPTSTENASPVATQFSVEKLADNATTTLYASPEGKAGAEGTLTRRWI